MNVWGSVKKFSLVGAMVVVGSVSFTGCLTDDKKEDPAPVDNSVKLTGENVNDTIWNIMGPNRGAFDLVNNTALSTSSAAAGKDLVDLSVATATGVDFPKTWKSLNSTMFVMAAAGFDYAGATDSSVVKAYKAGTPSAQTDVLAAGSIVLANLRAGTRYAIIKIDEVKDIPGTGTGTNNDFIRFSYKTTP